MFALIAFVIFASLCSKAGILWRALIPSSYGSLERTNRCLFKLQLFVFWQLVFVSRSLC